MTSITTHIKVAIACALLAATPVFSDAAHNITSKRHHLPPNPGMAVCPPLLGSGSLDGDIEAFSTQSMSRLDPGGAGADGISARTIGHQCTYLVDVSSDALDKQHDKNYAHNIAQAIKQDMSEKLGPYQHIDRNKTSNAVCYKGHFLAGDPSYRGSHYVYQCQIQFYVL
jgi:hypothetical protein